MGALRACGRGVRARAPPRDIETIFEDLVKKRTDALLVTAAVRRDRKIPKEGKLDATKRYRIWAQGAFAPAVAVDADRDDHRHRDDPPALAYLHVSGVVGIVEVAALAASDAGVLFATITLTRRRTRSAASSGNRS